MILVCLGTQDRTFERLLTMVEKCIDDGIINEEVVCQIGCSKYSGEKLKCFEYCSSDEMEALIDKCSFVITHGGTGTIVTALKKHKKVIAVNRLAKYHEHTDDHQIQIISQFVDTGYILSCFEEEDLGEKIKALASFEPKEFISNTENVLTYLRGYINNVLSQKK